MNPIQTREHVAPIARPAPVGPRGPSAAAGGTSMTGGDFLRIIRKRKWFIAISVIVSVLLSGVVTFVWLRQAPLFTAKATLLVNQPKRAALTPDMPYGKDVMDREVALWVQIARSQAILRDAVSNEKVRASQDLRNTAWYQRNDDTAVGRLLKDVGIAPAPNANAIIVSMTDYSAEDAAIVVQAVAEAAQRKALEVATAGRRGELARFQTEYQELNQKLASTRTRMAAARPADIPFIQERINVTGMELQALVSDQTKLVAEEAQAEAILRSIQVQKDQMGLEHVPQVLQALDMDSTLRFMEGTRVQYANELDKAKGTKFGPGHSKVKDLEARIESLDRQILDRRKELVQTQGQALMQMAEGGLEQVRAKLFWVKERLDEKKASTRDLESTLANIQQLENDEKGLVERIKNVEDRMVEIRLLASGEEPLSIYQSAERPLEPSMPRWIIMIPLGFVVGMLFGLGVSLALEMADTSVKSPADIVRRVELPVLGMVPHTDDIEDEIADLRLAFSSNPTSVISESFRQIRTCLQFSGPANQRRSLLITSPLPEDGRTSIATNLAASIARSGKRVLLVDANFRQPAMRKLFPLCPEGGLSAALVGQGDWRGMVGQIEPHLSVLAAGPMPPSPAELLGSDPMRRMIEEMTSEYDQVIFDGPPCLVVTDAAVLGTLVDGVVLVVRAGSSTFGIVQRARDMLSRLGVHMLGVVLDGVRVTAGGYLRKNYETFYEYQEVEMAPAVAAAADTPELAAK